MKSRREDALVGLLVLIAVALLVITFFALHGASHKGGTLYRTYFKSAEGIDAGTIVRFGGVRVGHVTRVGVGPRDRSRIFIDLRVAPGTPINTGSLAKISSLGLLGDNYIEVTTGQQNLPLLPAGSVIPSAPYTSIADITDAVGALTPKVNTALDNLNGRLNQLQDTINRVDNMLSEQNQKNLTAALAGLNGMVQENRPLLHATLANVNQDTEKLGPLIDNFKETARKADKTLDQLNGMLAEDRPHIRESIEELRQTLAQTSELAAHLNGTVTYNQDNLDEIVANLRRATENLASFTERIKTQPTSLIRATNYKEHRPGETAGH